MSTTAYEKLTRFENFRRAHGGWPIPFGDKEAINTLRTLEEEAENCDNCEGEGTIVCSACDGNGKRKKES